MVRVDLVSFMVVVFKDALVAVHLEEAHQVLLVAVQQVILEVYFLVEVHDSRDDLGEVLLNVAHLDHQHQVAYAYPSFEDHFIAFTAFFANRQSFEVLLRVHQAQLVRLVHELILVVALFLMVLNLFLLELLV